MPEILTQFPSNATMMPSGALGFPFQRAVAPGHVAVAEAFAIAVDGPAVTAFTTVHHSNPVEVFLATWAVWLHRISEQADVTIGVSVPGCSAPVTIAVGDARVAEVLTRAREATYKAPQASSASIPAGLTAGLTAAGEAPWPHAVPLHLVLGEAGQATLHVDAAVFTRQTATRFAEGFATLLAEVLANPQARVDTLEIVGPTERRQLLETWAPPPLDAYPLTHAYIEALALQQADAAALSCEGETWTFAEFNARINRLARHLQAQGVGPGSLVALHLPRGLEMPLAMYAVLKVGGAYVALEPSLPEERAAGLLELFGRPLLLSRQQPPASLAERASSVLVLDDLAAALAAHSADNLEVAVPPEAIAAVYLTSGSTGEPKPVVYTHRALSLGTSPKPSSTIGPGDTFLMRAPFSFIVALGVVGSLSAGAHVLLANPEAAASPVETFELIRSAGITHIFMVPAVLRASMQAIDALAPETRARLLNNRLRVMWAAGEPMTPEIVAEWWSRFGPGVSILNMYGQTETYSITQYPVPKDGLDVPALPVGRPGPGCRVYILDEHMALTPIGLPGMIYAASDWMSSGYLGQLDDDDKMVPNPFGPGRLCKTGDIGRFDEDGHLYIVGRLDHMVKIRGQRVELGEVEARLRAHPALRNVAVVGRADDAGGLRLVAFLVAGDGPSPTVAALRAFLAERLTPAMVPSAFVYLDALPTNSNGKVDQLLLRTMPFEPAPSEGEAIAPRDETEARLLGIWEGVLGFAGFGVKDHFFELGGDSLKAVHVMAQVEREFDCRVPIMVFAESPTIEALALAIARGETENPQSYIVPLRSGGALPPLILFPPIGGSPETFLGMARLLPASQPVYAGYLVGTQHDLDFNSSLPQLARIYVEEIRRKFLGRPLRLGGYSSGGGMAFEVARQLEALGHDVERLISFDTDMTQLQVAFLPPSVLDANRETGWRTTARLLLRAWQLGYGYRYPKLLPGLLALKERGLKGLGKQAPLVPVAAPNTMTAMRPASASTGQGALPPLSFSELLSRLDIAAAELLPGGREALRALLHAYPRVPMAERRARLYDFLDAHTPPKAELAPLELPAGRRGKIARSSYVLREAYGFYRPEGPIHAPVILVKAEDAPPAATHDMGWGALAASGLTCVSAPGDHHSMMWSPHLDVGIKRLCDALMAQPGVTDVRRV